MWGPLGQSHLCGHGISTEHMDNPIWGTCFSPFTTYMGPTYKCCLDSYHYRPRQWYTEKWPLLWPSCYADLKWNVGLTQVQCLWANPSSSFVAKKSLQPGSENWRKAFLEKLLSLHIDAHSFRIKCSTIMLGCPRFWPSSVHFLKEKKRCKYSEENKTKILSVTQKTHSFSHKTGIEQSW